MADSIARHSRCTPYTIQQFPGTTIGACQPGPDLLSPAPADRCADQPKHAVAVRILVSAASRHGSTAEIATRIAEALRAGLPGEAVVDVRPAAEAGDVTAYDAVVLGSAVYIGRWLEDARHVAARLAADSSRPVWLFSSGPIGDPPKRDEEPVDVSDIVKATEARGHRVFAGRLDRHRLGFGEKAMMLALRVSDGDFRGWPAIDAWGAHIAAELRRPIVT
jgi:menaquinone-dependent protoporphyrinogen oxidase